MTEISPAEMERYKAHLGKLARYDRKILFWKLVVGIALLFIIKNVGEWAFGMTIADMFHVVFG